MINTRSFHDVDIGKHIRIGLGVVPAEHKPVTYLQTLGSRGRTHEREDAAIPRQHPFER